MKNINLSELQNINVQDLGSLASKVWKKTCKLVLIVFWAVIIAAGSYFWYSIFYGPDWSEAEKANFLKAKFPQNDLDRAALEKVLKDGDARKEKFGREVFTVKNIFKIY